MEMANIVLIAVAALIVVGAGILVARRVKNRTNDGTGDIYPLF